ncbi:MAG TPA: type II toxin-antitoxin system ParD family antitoxin [Azospirillaceae bacterium]|nr:type II toxin-antitoxin system ParD family antitoxin [Azospirillaceae bacterium]
MLKLFLCENMHRFVQQLVASGRYRSETEVVEEALKLLHRHVDSEDMGLDECWKPLAAQAAIRAARSTGDCELDAYLAHLEASPARRKNPEAQATGRDTPAAEHQAQTPVFDPKDR